MRPCVGVTFIVFVVVTMLSTSAAAQVFSPGPLSSVHAHVEGLTSCKQCHGPEGGGHADDGACLACHLEIKTRRDARRGYHARTTGETCASCHKEHRGVGAQLVVFSPSEPRFDHRQTGFVLEGQHKKNDCRSCHDDRRVVAEDVRALVLARPNKRTFLGLPTTCASCHFDEHRGQEGSDCKKCHTPERFAPAPLFDHSTMSDFPLTGKHMRQDCAKCHALVDDTHTADDTFPPPKNVRQFRNYNTVKHDTCVACHDDHHAGRLGVRCEQCHTTESWQIRVEPTDRTFHDTTHFPLKGRHKEVACTTCHGPHGRGRQQTPAVYRGLEHERCTDCHVDGHLDGAVTTVPAKNNGTPPRCDRCHDENGFASARFTLAMHDEARFVVDGGHRAVGCVACHGRDADRAKRVDATIRQALLRQRRPLRISDFRMARPDVQIVDDNGHGRCADCHTDEHRGQFKQRVDAGGCQSCHVPPTSSFNRVRFDHDDSRFPLTGAHHTVACALCHQPDPQQAGSSARDVVVYRPLSLECASCHADVHTGQLARNGSTDCARCHRTTRFEKAERFGHDDSRFPLIGRHRDVACAKCHPVSERDGIKSARYTPLPIDCAGCHVDEHKGDFDGYAP